MGLLALAGSIAAPLIGNLVQNRMNRKASERAFNKEMELVKYQNEYNSPKNQMARLREAGLSPHLAFGGGNISGNLTGSMPNYQEAPKQFDLEGAVNTGIKAYREVNYTNILKAQEDKMLTDIEYTKQKTIQEAIRNDILATQNLKSGFEFNQLKELAPYQLEIKKQNAAKASVELENLYKQGELRSSELETKRINRAYIVAKIAETLKNTERTQQYINLLSRGITPSDPWFVRMGSQLLEAIGLSSWSDVKSAMEESRITPYKE